MKVFCNTFCAISLEESGLWFLSCKTKVPGIALSLIRTEQNAMWMVSCQAMSWQQDWNRQAMRQELDTEPCSPKASRNFPERTEILWFNTLMLHEVTLNRHVTCAWNCRVVPIGLNAFFLAHPADRLVLSARRISLCCCRSACAKCWPSPGRQATQGTSTSPYQTSWFISS